MSPPVEIEMFGGLRVRAHGREVRLPTRKTAALLAYLAHYAGRDHARELLVETFWPDSELESGRKSLSVALTALRRALEPGEVERGFVLRTGRVTASLNEQAVATDAGRFENLLDRAAQTSDLPERARLLTEATSTAAGAFLPGFYEDWAVSEADRLSLRRRAALEELCELLSAAGDGALLAARRLVELDPLSEAGYQRLMRLHAAAGHRGEVLRQFRHLEDVLRSELETSPSEATRALLDELLHEPAPRASLPAQSTSFVGREDERAEIRRLLLSGARVIALTGPGGVGKTRLALETARELQQEGHRVAFAALAHVECGARLPAELARALAGDAPPDQDPMELLPAALSGTDLLVLDNLEQVLEGAEDLLAGLLDRVPEVCCLVTSRRSPAVSGAWEVPVPPLGLPTSEENPEPEGVQRSESVQLFESRSRMLRPGFAVTRENAGAVSALCRRLDGLPLALELAAARMHVLTPAQVLAQMEATPGVLADPRRRRPARHASLEATLEWSYRLLSPAEQELFRRLAVFRGGWTLDAAERVWDGPVLDLLSALRASSLILAEETPAGMRYRMLETLRDFGRAQLTPEELTEARRRHRDYLIDLAGNTDSHDPAAVDALDREQPNVWAALEWCCQEPSEAEAGLRLAGAHGWFWGLRGHGDQGRMYLDRLLALPEAGAPTVWRARALIAAGFFARADGNRSQAAVQFEEALSIARAEERQGMVTHALSALGLLEADRGNLVAGRRRLEECLTLMEQAGQRYGKSALLHSLARLAQMQGDLPAARRRLEESRALSDELGDLRCQARSRAYLGSVAADEGHPADARALLEEAVDRARALGENAALAEFLNLAGSLALDEGRVGDARSCWSEAEGLARTARSRRELARSLCGLARLACREGRPEAALARHAEALEIRLRLQVQTDLAESALYAREALQAAGRPCACSLEAADGCSEPGACLLQSLRRALADTTSPLPAQLEVTTVRETGS